MLGKSGRFDGDDVLDLLLARPETARYVTAKLWREFVSPDPDPAEVRASPRASASRATTSRPRCASCCSATRSTRRENRGVLVKSPTELVVGTLRSLGLEPERTLPLRARRGRHGPEPDVAAQRQGLARRRDVDQHDDAARAQAVRRSRHARRRHAPRRRDGARPRCNARRARRQRPRTARWSADCRASTSTARGSSPSFPARRPSERAPMGAAPAAAGGAAAGGRSAGGLARRRARAACSTPPISSNDHGPPRLSAIVAFRRRAPGARRRLGVGRVRGRARRRANYRNLLVLIELKGGNDGLNTVVPYADPTYYALRPKLAIARDAVVQLSDRAGLHPALAPLLPLWQRPASSRCCRVSAIPRRTCRIFARSRSGTRRRRATTTCRRMAHARVRRGAACRARSPPTASSSAATIWARSPAAARAPSRCRTPKRSCVRRGSRRRPARRATRPTGTSCGSKPTSCRRRRISTRDARSRPSFRRGGFGNAIRTACQIIANPSGVAVVRVSLSGFDTHGGQAATQARLLGELARGIVALKSALDELGRWNDTLILTYAEFGRRPRENLSGGTDHGTANVHFALGGRVAGGFYGEAPTLDRLSGDGNAGYALDFRAIYATVLERWWGMPSQPALARALRAGAVRQAPDSRVRTGTRQRRCAGSRRVGVPRGDELQPMRRVDRRDPLARERDFLRVLARRQFAAQSDESAGRRGTCSSRRSRNSGGRRRACPRRSRRALRCRPSRACRESRTAAPSRRGRPWRAAGTSRARP